MLFLPSKILKLFMSHQKRAPHQSGLQIIWKALLNNLFFFFLVCASIHETLPLVPPEKGPIFAGALPHNPLKGSTPGFWKQLRIIRPPKTSRSFQLLPPNIQENQNKVFQVFCKSQGGVRRWSSQTLILRMLCTKSFPTLFCNASYQTMLSTKNIPNFLVAIKVALRNSLTAPQNI